LSDNAADSTLRNNEIPYGFESNPDCSRRIIAANAIRFHSCGSTIAGSFAKYCSATVGSRLDLVRSGATLRMIAVVGSTKTPYNKSNVTDQFWLSMDAELERADHFTGNTILERTSL